MFFEDRSVSLGFEFSELLADSVGSIAFITTGLSELFKHRSDEVLAKIVDQGGGVLKEVIGFLKMCIAVMRSDGRDDQLLMKDVDRAGRLLRS